MPIPPEHRLSPEVREFFEARTRWFYPGDEATYWPIRRAREAQQAEYFAEYFAEARWSRQCRRWATKHAQRQET